MQASRIVVTLAALAAMTSAAAAQPTVGTPFGTRAPQTCTSTKDPARGAISAARARLYVICSVELVSDGSIHLLENVQVEVGKGTPYRELSFGARPNDGDPNGLVYQIRGSYLDYTCYEIAHSAPGRSCHIRNAAHATGYCYRTTFGDWACSLTDNLAEFKTGTPPAR